MATSRNVLVIQTLDAGAVHDVLSVEVVSCLRCGTDDLHLCGAKPLASFWLLLFAGDICVVDQLAVSLLVGTLSCTLVSRGLSTNSFW